MISLVITYFRLIWQDKLEKSAKKRYNISMIQNVPITDGNPPVGKTKISQLHQVIGMQVKTHLQTGSLSFFAAKSIAEDVFDLFTDTMTTEEYYKILSFLKEKHVILRNIVI